MRATSNLPAASRPRGPRAFTLTELLVVIGIIGVLATASVPAIRSLSRTNTKAAGDRQMLDELAYARQLAINGHKTVYLVFVPPTMRGHFDTIRNELRHAEWARQLRQTTNLVNGQYTAYALFSRRTVGDQPGRQTPRYLTAWRHLPDGVLFRTNKFVDLGNQWSAMVKQVYGSQYTNYPLPYARFPFPAADSPLMRLPYLAFDPFGKVLYEEGGYTTLQNDQQYAWLTLTRGSIFYPKSPQMKWAYDLQAAPDVVETPRFNRTDIRVNWLTGRARVEEVKIQ